LAQASAQGAMATMETSPAVVPPAAPSLHGRELKTEPVGQPTAVPLTSAALQMHTGMLPIHRVVSGQSIASLGFETSGSGPVVIQPMGEGAVAPKQAADATQEDIMDFLGGGRA